jgi:NAD(P)-dependent dehydrogenase (short-subunit alcohol dehydrogenase family)
MNRLQGKVSVITGGTSGFGFSIAELFVREGAKVIIAARRKEKGLTAIKKIKELTGAEVEFFQCDISQEDEVRDLVDKAIDIYKRVEVWVNNAGVIIRKNFEDTTEEEWDRLMDINLKGNFFCCKYIVPFMIKNRGGSIINISSNVGLLGKGNMPIYSTSKGGLVLLTRSLALRYAKHNIRVNSICPGTIITELNRDFYEKSKDSYKKMKELISAYPLGRLGAPIDVAYAALYLASNESQWVSGIALPVDGGYSAGRE